MRVPKGRFLFLVIASFLLPSCGPKEPPRAPVFGPVTGQVLVDGAPAAGIKVIGFSSAPADKRVVPGATTDAEGKFSMYTYEPNDGMPSGEYTLLFLWQGENFLNPGPDKLHGRYADEKKSPVKCKVEEGPVDLGKIELTTK